MAGRLDAELAAADRLVQPACLELPLLDPQVAREPVVDSGGIMFIHG